MKTQKKAASRVMHRGITVAQWGRRNIGTENHDSGGGSRPAEMINTNYFS